MVITTAQLHSTKPELRFWAGLNPACGVSEIRDGEDWKRLTPSVGNLYHKNSSSSSPFSLSSAIVKLKKKKNQNQKNFAKKFPQFSILTLHLFPWFIFRKLVNSTT